MRQGAFPEPPRAESPGLKRAKPASIGDFRLPIFDWQPLAPDKAHELANQFGNRQSAIGNPLIPYWSGPPIGDFGLTIFD